MVNFRKSLISRVSPLVRAIAALLSLIAIAPESRAESIALLPPAKEDLSSAPILRAENIALLPPAREDLSSAPIPKLDVKVDVKEKINSDAELLEQIRIYSGERDENNEIMQQIINVSSLRDVAPGDWAYKALRNLVERYGCLAGYPQSTYQGNQVLTRFEFAAGLNACFQKMEELITASNSVTDNDLATMQRLLEEFAVELASLNEQIDNLEGNIAFLEDYQFSTTTKLFGVIRFSAQSFFSGEGDTSSVLQYSTVLTLVTSFTGQDSLTTSFSATSTPLPELATTNDGNEVGSTREGTALTAGAGNTNNDLFLTNLEYQFPVSENFFVNVRGFAFFRRSEVLLSHFLPYYNFPDGPVSTFAQSPPVFRIGSGPGITLSYKLLESVGLDVSYYATWGGDPSPGMGLFNGDYIAAAQLSYNPAEEFYVEFIYLNGYFGAGRFSFDQGLDFNKGFVGTALANRFDESGILFDEDSSVSANSYMLLAYYAITPKFLIGGSINKISARLIGKGDADIWTYWVALTSPDLFKEGSLAGFIVGMEPTLTGFTSGLPSKDFKNDTSLHIEAYYRYPVNDNISITPAVIWITAPNQDADNEDIVVGVIRTTFSF